MKKIKVIIGQTMMVSFMVLCAVSIYGLFVMRKYEWAFDWYIPGSIVVSSFACSAVTCLLLYNDGYARSRLSFVVRTILHFILLYGIIMAFGHMCYWYRSLRGGIIVSIIYVVVYFGAWIGTSIMFRHDEKVISDALESVRDKE